MDRRETTPPSPAPGEEDSVALALANTWFQTDGRAMDAISRPDEALAWLDRHGLLPGRRAQPGGSEVVAQLGALRGAIRALFVARMKDDAPPRPAVSLLNATLEAVPWVATLSWVDAQPPTREQRPAGGDALSRALALLSADALGLITGPEAAMLASCGAPGCIRLMLRTHGKRLWCSTRCGDRVRAARYYQRSRAGSKT